MTRSLMEDANWIQVIQGQSLCDSHYGCPVFRGGDHTRGGTRSEVSIACHPWHDQLPGNGCGRREKETIGVSASQHLSDFSSWKPAHIFQLFWVNLEQHSQSTAAEVTVLKTAAFMYNRNSSYLKQQHSRIIQTAAFMYNTNSNYLKQQHSCITETAAT